MLSNYSTEVKMRVDSDKNVAMPAMRKLLDEAMPHLKHSETYAWDANINGIIVRLVTNSKHQYAFWQDNWWPGPNNYTVKPHAFLYSINGIAGKQPYAYYCPQKDTALFVNTEYYGQCKSWALGIAAKILQEKHAVHSIHGACADVDGRGVVIVAPTGAGKTTQINRLFMHPKGKIVGDDWVYVQHATDDKPISFLVTQPERCLYMRTENARHERWLLPLLERCKLENVVEDKQQCHHPDGEECGFDLDMGFCFWGFRNSRALLPREWMGGREKVRNRTSLDLIVLLRRDNTSPAEVQLTTDEAIAILKEGKCVVGPGSAPKEKWGSISYEPWYNPYLLVKDDQAQDDFFRRELELAKCIIINTGAPGETIERTHQRILKAALG